MKTYLQLISIHIFLTLVICNTISGQRLYVSTLDDDIYRLDLTTCEVDWIVRVNKQVFDIAFHPNGKLFGISGNGEFYYIDTITGLTNLIYEFDDGQDFNSMTISAHGIVYVSGSNGKLFSYNLTTDQGIFIGRINEMASGDLTFYKGRLYLAVVGDNIWYLDINDFDNSYEVIDEDLPGNIYGIVSYAESCEDITPYAITDGDSDVYQINFGTGSMELVCELNIEIGGGASTFEFLASAPIEIANITVTPSTCNENNGSISINATGGVGILQYSINGITFQSSPVFNQLPPGSYTITIKDPNGCEVETTAVIMAGGRPEILNTVVIPETCRQHNGQLEIQAQGGVPPLQYSLDNMNFGFSSSFSTLNSGSYIAYVRDANGCLDSVQVEVEEIVPVAIDTILVGHTTCGLENGSIDVVITNGSAPFEYTWQGVSGSFTNVITNLLPGNYQLTVQDALGCIATADIVVHGSNHVAIDSIPVIPETCKAGNGGITIFATSDNSPLQFSINGVNYIDNPNFDNLSGGQYAVIVIDTFGCELHAEATVHQIEPIEITELIVVNTTCGLDNGNFEVHTNGVEINEVHLNQAIVQQQLIFNDLDAGIYNVVIEDIHFCQDSIIAIIDGSTNPIFQSIFIDHATCALANGQIEILEVAQGISVLYAINGNPLQESGVFVLLDEGEYDLRIEDEYGCFIDSTVRVTTSPPVVLENVASSNAACGYTNASMSFVISGGTGAYTIALNSQEVDEAVINGLSPGAYDIVIMDSLGCTVDTAVTIHQDKCPVFLPNSFSPNGDGFNDEYIVSVHPSFLGQIKLFEVVDRWGSQVYRAQGLSDQRNFTWDGVAFGKEAAPGVYLAMVQIIHDDGSFEKLSTDITLLR